MGMWGGGFAGGKTLFGVALKGIQVWEYHICFLIFFWRGGDFYVDIPVSNGKKAWMSFPCPLSSLQGAEAERGTESLNAGGSPTLRRLTVVSRSKRDTCEMFLLLR